MPKVKTHKGAKKRFKTTATGKVTHAKAGRRHILTGKAPKRMRDLREKGQIPGAAAKMIRFLLGN